MTSMTCKAPWDGLFVWFDGTASYCGRTPMTGALRHQTFREFWNSERIRSVRQHFLNDERIQSGCPPTCNFLTATEPGTYVKYYDARAEPASHHPQPDPVTIARTEVPGVNPSNEDLIEYEIASGATRSDGYPTRLTLQLFNYCTLQCPMCCFGIIPKHEKKNTAVFLENPLLDNLRELYPHLERVQILGGELFDIPYGRNPLVKVIRDLAELGSNRLKVEIVTNGQHLSTAWAEFIVEHPFIDQVSFSIDSFLPEVYDKVRTVGSLDKVRASARRLLDAKRARESAFPVVMMKSILSLQTVAGIRNFHDEAHALGADSIEFQPLVEMGEDGFYKANNIFQTSREPEIAQAWADICRCDYNNNRREIAGMLSSFLDHLGRTDEWLARRKDLPQAAQYGHEAAIGPICGAAEATQMFVAKRDSVRHIRIMFATYMRANTHDIEVLVENDTTTLTQAKFSSVDLADNSWVEIEVPEARLVPGARYSLRVRSPASTGENALALRCSSHGEGLTFNQEDTGMGAACMVF